MPEAAAPRIFMSYSHDNPTHCDRVLALADRLRADGIDAVIDQYIPTPPEGWLVRSADRRGGFCADGLHRDLSSPG